MEYLLLKIGIILIIGVITALYRVRGNKKKSNLANIQKSMNDFKNRPIYPVLTSEIIDSIPDKKLLQTIFDNIIEKIPKNFIKEDEIITSLSKERQAIYIIWCIEAEINNGGFNQYYFNSSSKFADLAPDAFILVGGLKFAGLMMKANDIYKKQYEQITKYQDGTLEGFSKSYENNPLSECDNDFYELYNTEELEKLQIDFIRKNKLKFID